MLGPVLSGLNAVDVEQLLNFRVLRVVFELVQPKHLLLHL